MITEAQWAAVKDAIDRVCDRQSDREDTHDGGFTVRRTDHGAIVAVWTTAWNLEPEGE